MGAVRGYVFLTFPKPTPSCMRSETNNNALSNLSYNGYSADLQMRHQKLFTLVRHLSVGHFSKLTQRRNGKLGRFLEYKTARKRCFTFRWNMNYLCILAIVIVMGLQTM